MIKHLKKHWYNGGLGFTIYGRIVFGFVIACVTFIYGKCALAEDVSSTITIVQDANRDFLYLFLAVLLGFFTIWHIMRKL